MIQRKVMKCDICEQTIDEGSAVSTLVLPIPRGLRDEIQRQIEAEHKQRETAGHPVFGVLFGRPQVPTQWRMEFHPGCVTGFIPDIDRKLSQDIRRVINEAQAAKARSEALEREERVGEFES